MTAVEAPLLPVEQEVLAAYLDRARASPTPQPSSSGPRGAAQAALQPPGFAQSAQQHQPGQQQQPQDFAQSAQQRDTQQDQQQRNFAQSTQREDLQQQQLGQGQRGFAQSAQQRDLQQHQQCQGQPAGEQAPVQQRLLRPRRAAVWEIPPASSEGSDADYEPLRAPPARRSGGGQSRARNRCGPQTL